MERHGQTMKFLRRQMLLVDGNISLHCLHAHTHNKTLFFTVHTYVSFKKIMWIYTNLAVFSWDFSLHFSSFHDARLVLKEIQAMAEISCWMHAVPKVPLAWYENGIPPKSWTATGYIINLGLVRIYWELPPTCNSPKRRVVGSPYWNQKVNPLRLLQGGARTQRICSTSYHDFLPYPSLQKYTIAQQHPSQDNSSCLFIGRSRPRAAPGL